MARPEIRDQAPASFNTVDAVANWLSPIRQCNLRSVPEVPTDDLLFPGVAAVKDGVGYRTCVVRRERDPLRGSRLSWGRDIPKEPLALVKVVAGDCRGADPLRRALGGHRSDNSEA